MSDVTEARVDATAGNEDAKERTVARRASGESSIGGGELAEGELKREGWALSGRSQLLPNNEGRKRRCTNRS